MTVCKIAVPKRCGKEYCCRCYSTNVIRSPDCYCKDCLAFMPQFLTHADMVRVVANLDNFRMNEELERLDRLVQE